MYYVSPDGKETSGNNQPRLGQCAFLNSAPNGATIVFRGAPTATYSIRRKLTLQPYPHEKVWLKGIKARLVADGATWRKDEWTTALQCEQYLS